MMNTTKRCSFCGQPITPDQPSVPDDNGEPGDRMHIECSLDLQDGDDITNDFWD